MKRSTKNSVESKKKDVVGREKSVHYEFGGPVGAAAMLLTLPLTVYLLNLVCGVDQCSLVVLPSWPRWQKWFDLRIFGGLGLYLVVMAFQAVLPLGNVANGLPLSTGKRLQYRCNGLISFWITIIGYTAIWYFNVFPINELILKNFYSIMTGATLFSYLFSVYLYARSLRVSKSELSPGESGNFFYDFFMGRELNPRWGSLDLKFFFELRPGLIGWVLIDLSMVLSTLDRNDLLAPPNNPSLILISLCHAWYVHDALVYEKSILSTMDIITEGFGFMLCFGDVVWVPFLYTLSARFAFMYNPQMPLVYLLSACLLHLIGFVIFRGSNSQKDSFRANPDAPEFKSMPLVKTDTKKLLAGGWWGVCRKPNYLGDLLMALSWSMMTGGTHLLPYFYPVYFLILLVHRERRDNAACREKYGRYWDEYCCLVRYRIFPYIY